MADDLSFMTLDVFSYQAFGGNPLAVFPRAEHLDSAQIAAYRAGDELFRNHVHITSQGSRAYGTSAIFYSYDRATFRRAS